MALAQGTADFQLLTDGEGLFGTNNLEFPDTVALATLNGDEVGNGTKVDLLPSNDRNRGFPDRNR